MPHIQTSSQQWGAYGSTCQTHWKWMRCPGQTHLVCGIMDRTGPQSQPWPWKWLQAEICSPVLSKPSSHQHLATLVTILTKGRCILHGPAIMSCIEWHLQQKLKSSGQFVMDSQEERRQEPPVCVCVCVCARARARMCMDLYSAASGRQCWLMSI